MQRTWEFNADEFGSLTRQDKDFRLAALVACSVERHTNRFSVSTDTLKTSMRQFAERAGCDKMTVTRYFRNWEAMANEGVVPQPESLTPDDVNGLLQSMAEVPPEWHELETNRPIQRPQPSPDIEPPPAPNHYGNACNIVANATTRLEHLPAVIPQFTDRGEIETLTNALVRLREAVDFMLIQLGEQANV